MTQKSGDDISQNLIFIAHMKFGVPVQLSTPAHPPDLRSSRVRCGRASRRRGRSRAQVAGDLEYPALLVEVDGVDGKAHKAHVDAVARLNQQGCGGRQGAAKHQAA